MQFWVTPLHVAAWYGQSLAVEALLQAGANVNTQQKNFVSLLLRQ